MYQKLRQFFKFKDGVILSAIFLIFLLLLFKDPFSDRTLIPNFEPYPDTFYYINPALSLIKGQGFNFNREGRIFKANVPPLYSLTLIPSFILDPDPRMAYYSNIVLAAISLYFFYLILRRVLANKLIIYLLLVLYVTNYFIYWVPSLVMAENLILTLYLAAIYFLLVKVTVLNSIIIGFLIVGVYATKFSSIPVSGSIAALFLGKILLTKLKFKMRMKYVFIFLLTAILCYSALQVFLQINNQYSIISEILTNLLLIKDSLPGVTPTPRKPDASIWFGIQFMEVNLPLYINSLIGNPNRFLWDNTPLVPKLVALGGIAGILGGIIYKKFRFISLSLFITVLFLVIFQSTFYSFDARYIYVVIPALLIGLGILLDLFFQKVFTEKKIIFFNSLIIILITIYLISSFIRIKSQISLNLRYRETPWNYIAVMKMNEYFTPEMMKENKKPVLISALPPFLIDYYSNNNYILLPLAYEQEFRGQNNREIIWGPNDYSDLPKLYRKYLSKGYDLYVSRAGLGNESYTNKDFNTIADVFDIKLVLPGCFDQCNIYSVRLKDDNGK